MYSFEFSINVVKDQQAIESHEHGAAAQSVSARFSTCHDLRILNFCYVVCSS